MHIRLLAVGDRQPSWVDAAFDEYSGRLPRQWQFRLQTVPVARRGKAGGIAGALAAEERGLLAHLRPGEYLILLDERGEQLSSTGLAARLGAWQEGGRDLCFVVGGPDGVADAVRQHAEFCWSLSMLTLPHGLVRVLLAEQLYRAWSIATHHPYHRD